MDKKSASIEILCELIPQELWNSSGKVFYSGRLAFIQAVPLYVIGMNPGGAPDTIPEETLASHTKLVRTKFPPNWSAYRDESWEGAAAGGWGMQPRVLHMFRNLGLDPGKVPCSNLVFIRSRQEVDLKQELSCLVNLCWPFHAAVIERLHPRVIVCFGRTAGDVVRVRLSANDEYENFEEKNDRHWRSRAYKNANGLKVIVVTHPSRANWVNSKTDPTALIAAALT